MTLNSSGYGLQEPENNEILALKVFKERNMFVAERFLSEMVKEYDKHPVSTDGVVLGTNSKHVSFWN